MSNAVQGYVWDITFPTQSQKLIALKLADHSNGEGTNVWPSKARVAREVGCSETTVQLTLKVFRNCGLLEVLEEGGKGPGDTTKYRLNVQVLRELAAERRTIEGTANNLILTPNLTPNKGSESDGIENRWDRAKKAKGSDRPKKGVGITDPEPPSKNPHSLEPPFSASKKNTDPNYWANALSPPPDPETTPHVGVTLADGKIKLHNGTKAHWLARFDGDANRLELALEQAVGWIQPSSGRPLEAQVGSQLARQLADKIDRDNRYKNVKQSPVVSKAREIVNRRIAEGAKK